MKNPLIAVSVSVLGIFALILLTHNSMAYGQATRQTTRIGLVYGGDGYIKHTNPNLDTNGDSGPSAGVYHRIAVSTSLAYSGVPVTAFAEIGWIKNKFTCYPEMQPRRYVALLISYTNWRGAIEQDYRLCLDIQVTMRRYSVQYNPIAGLNNWNFYLDGKIISNTSWGSNLGISNVVVAGGETYLGIESMGFTNFSNLKWIKMRQDGSNTLVLKPWKNNVYRINLPNSGVYTCDLLSLTNHTCRHVLYG